jgi:hypothetical protein
LFSTQAFVPWVLVDPLPEEPRSSRWPQTIAFVVSAAVAAGTLRFAWHQPLLAAAGLGGVFVFVASRWFARRRLRRLLRSGNVQSVLQRWAPSFTRIAHPATMAPLMTATAFAAYGWVSQARAAMASAARGPAWEAALEHRLFLDAILLTFEGDRDAALEQAGRLERLPLPPSGGALRDRVLMLRIAVGALARAFAHRSEPGDRERLEQASEASPLVFWAMRYAAAVIAVDQGDREKAMTLLASAPTWPTESIFRAFHDEIVTQLAA